MVADRAAAIADAEAALGDLGDELDELAGRLCALVYDAWLRRQNDLATDTPTHEDRAAQTHAARPSSTDEEESCAQTTGRPEHIVPHT